MNKQPSPPQESVVDKVNRFLARLMGKKPYGGDSRQSSAPTVPGNLRFILIVTSMIVVLWGLTGIYFIPDGSYGIILTNGKISKVVTGMRTGINIPFPFSEVITLDSTGNNTKFGALESSPYLVMTADNRQLAISGEIGYHIENPQKYFINYYQETSDLDERVRWLAGTMIQDYFLHHSSNDILQNSNSVTGNEIRQASGNVLSRYGLSIDKLSLATVKTVESLSPIAARVASRENNSVNLAQQLITQAKQYSVSKTKDDTQLIAEFNQLMPQYRTNPKIIAELMYYKMLSSIPQTQESFPLLRLTLSQLHEMNSVGGSIDEPGAKNPRTVHRGVNRSVIRFRWGTE